MSRVVPRRAAWACMAALVATLMAVGLSPARTSASSPSLPSTWAQFTLSYKDGSSDLRLGPDGRWWVPEQFGTGIDRVTLAGIDDPFRWSSLLSSPKIAAGSDGNIWMTSVANT